jgi:hypothetical protein
MPGDLDYVSTDDLIAELKRRHVSALIVLEARTPVGEKGLDVIIESHGSLSSVYGLSAYVRQTLVREMRRGWHRTEES